jgi:hypothetical protein
MVTISKYPNQQLLNLKKEKTMDDFQLEGDFADFVDELQSSEKNENACSIDNPDCEGCGS